jgi:hypothetical protein
VSRWWTETVAAIGDVIPLPWLALLVLGVAGLVAAGWYWFPAWVPRRLPRLRRPRWRWRRRTRRAKATLTEQEVQELLGSDELPELPVATYLSLADRLAAEGRYAEAVRERLRAMVRELVERRVIEHRPGWTVTELAMAARQARPVVDPPVRTAGGVFSDLWYGERPARAEHDAQMRRLADELHHMLTAAPPGPAAPAGLAPSPGLAELPGSAVPPPGAAPPGAAQPAHVETGGPR